MSYCIDKKIQINTQIVKTSTKLNIKPFKYNVEEFIGKIPGKLLLINTLSLCLIIIALFLSIFLVKFPDIIYSDVLLVSKNIYTNVKNEYPGVINQIFLQNESLVESGEPIALMNSSQSLMEIVKFEQDLNTFYEAFVSKTDLIGISIPSKFKEEEVVQDYDHFMITWKRYLNKISNKSIIEEKNNIIVEISSIKREERNLLLQELEIVESQYNSLKYLNKTGFISSQNVEEAELNLIKTQKMINSIDIELLNFESNILNIQESFFEEQQQFYDNLLTATSNLLNSFQSWKNKHLIISPARGKLTYINFLAEKQFLDENTVLFAIVPLKKDTIFGKISLSKSETDRISLGDRVNISFGRYSPVNYGKLQGQIVRKSLVPNEKNYMIDVMLVNGLVTTNGKAITYESGMTGKAEIITSEDTLFVKYQNANYVLEDSSIID